MKAIIKKYGGKVMGLAAGGAWLVVLGFGFIKLYNYEFQSGPTSHTVSDWPVGTSVPRQRDIFQLVMVIHPQCPCTKATLGELELIMAQGQGKVSTYLLFMRPKQFNEEWVKSDLFKTASNIPGVRVLIDDEGRQGKLFGGTTSGQTFLYNPHGRLVFTGGITKSRGHAGDNIGESTIIALINNKPAQVKQTDFFGCLLEDRPIDETVDRRGS